MRKSQVARTALVIAAVTMLSLAEAEAQGPGQSGQAPAPPPASPESASAAKPGEGAAAGAKTEAGDASKPAETAPSPSADPATQPDGDSQRATFAALLKEGFEVSTTTFVPADAVTRQSGKVSLDAIVVTLQKDAASAVCFYTLKAYLSKQLGAIPACTVHR